MDALEADGFVERRSHPTDRRATVVALTEQGAAAAARMEAERHEAAHAALAGVSNADLAAFVVVVDRLLGLFGAETSGLRADRGLGREPFRSKPESTGSGLNGT